MNYLPYKFLILSIFPSLMAFCEDSYIIQIPHDIDLAKQNNFEVSIVDNGLKDNQTINVVFDDEFVLSDKHGKADIYGSVNNSFISFTTSDTNPKSIYYSIDAIPVGEWSGDLNMTISLEESLPSNTLLSGNEINGILQEIKPNIINFSHEKINDNYAYDLSLAQDESVLLYIMDEFSEEITITNNKNVPIVASDDMSYTFANLKSLLQINNINYLDTSDTSDMSHMFDNSTMLSSIQGINSLNTSSCTDMSYMFNYCSSLETLSLSNWNTSNVENMKYMFSQTAIYDLTGLDSFNTQNVLDMSYMFEGSSDLYELAINNWNVEKVTNMSNMFASAGIKTLDLGSWNPKECSDFSSMFYMCRSITSIGGLTNWQTTKLTNMNKMFANCAKLISLDLSNFNVSLVEDMASLFNECAKLQTIGDVSNWNVSNVKTFNKCFYQTPVFTDYNYLENWNVSNNCEDLSYMFYGALTNFPTNLNLSKWRTGGCKTMEYMFYNCFPLETLNITNWDTSNVETMASMFEANNKKYQSHLATITNIENINTSSLKDLSRAFYFARAFAADLSKWNVANVTTLNNTFYGNWYLDLSKLEKWNVSKVSDMTDCFANSAGRFTGGNTPTWYN